MNSAFLILQYRKASLQHTPGHELCVAAQDDVRAPPGHVGRDRDRPPPPALGHDLRLPLDVLRLGVQQLEPDACVSTQY